VVSNGEPILCSAQNSEEKVMTAETLPEVSKSDRGFQNIVGGTPAMETLYQLIAKAARSTHPVLILGESGTGKEMVAKAIHYGGPCGDKPFVPVDCGSLVPSLVESELFGYAKGAFTGALAVESGTVGNGRWRHNISR
jgi:two-component system response regulator HydG